jgi:PAS domain S-box-containing protein
MRSSISRVGRDGLQPPRVDARVTSLTATALAALLVAASYYVGSEVGFAVRFPSIPTSIVWPPNSILMAALMLAPPRRWWVYLLATLPAHILIQSQTAVPLPAMLFLFVTNAGEAALGAYFVRRLCGGLPRFGRLRDLVVFFVFAVFAAPFLTTYADAATVVLTKWGDDYSLVWRARFLSNVLTVITLVPAIVMWTANGRNWLRAAPPRRIAEGGLLALGLGVAYTFAYSESSFGPSFVPARLYTPLPFLVWAALRFGAGGVSTSLLAVLLISVSYAIGGRGTFNSRSPAEDVVGLQLFLIAISVPMMVLAAVTEERRRATEALKESEKRFRLMADATPLMVWMSGPDKLCTYLNRDWLDFRGRTTEQELGNGWAEGIRSEDSDRCLRTYTTSFDARLPFTMEYRLRRHDGEYRWVLDKGVPYYSPSGTFLGYIGSCLDITERKRAEQALEQLTGKLLQLQDEERRRIARELHDTTAQNLLAIVLNLETLVQKASTLPKDFSDAVIECQSLCEQTQAEIRTLSYLLHPPMLDEAGLILALEWFIDGFSRRSGIRVDFVAPPDFRRLPPQMETALFRVVQESLTNIYRHSGSTTAEISLERAGGRVCLRVTDRGRGMAAATGNGSGNGAGAHAKRAETVGVGISGMRERLRQLGGRLEVSSDGVGTTVTAVLPLGKRGNG